VFFNPARDFLIRRPGRDKRLKFVTLNAGFMEKFLIHGTAKAKIPFDAEQCRAAFVQGSSGHLKSTELIVSGARLLSAQIPRQRL